MPDEIENYVHRIGRTGRCGKTGVATTFINKASNSLEKGALLGIAVFFLASGGVVFCDDDFHRRGTQAVDVRAFLAVAVFCVSQRLFGTHFVEVGLETSSSGVGCHPSRSQAFRYLCPYSRWLATTPVANSCR